MPTSPGVYFFKDRDENIIYVGKAKHLSHRISSYFRGNLGEKTQAMMSKAGFLSFIEVGSELESILLEAKLITQLKPFYNLISKDDKTPYYIHVTDRPVINHQSTKAIAGPFLNRLMPVRILKYFRHLAPYCTAPKSQKNSCLYSHLGLCNPCPHGPNFSITGYRQNIRHLKLLLLGKFGQFRKSQIRYMNIYSKNQEYEKAQVIKNHLDYLNALLQRPILPEDYLLNPNFEIDKRNESIHQLQNQLSKYFPRIILNRIETYDIANLQGKQATAAMTVAINGHIDSRHFRHFKIKTVVGVNDPAMLAEVVSRRLTHDDWPMPDLIVLDGGKPQLSAINTTIPTISLAKKLETIIIFYNNEYTEINLPRHNSGLQLLQHLRDEAHRFSRRLHHKYRSRIIKS